MPLSLKAQLQERGLSEAQQEELWKWLNPSGKKGVASF